MALILADLFDCWAASTSSRPAGSRLYTTPVHCTQQLRYLFIVLQKADYTAPAAELNWRAVGAVDVTSLAAPAVSLPQLCGALNAIINGRLPPPPTASIRSHPLKRATGSFTSLPSTVSDASAARAQDRAAVVLSGSAETSGLRQVCQVAQAALQLALFARQTRRALVHVLTASVEAGHQRLVTALATVQTVRRENYLDHCCAPAHSTTAASSPVC